MKKLKEILLSDQISELRAKRDKFIRVINRQIDKKQIELEAICTHSEKKTIEENYEGGYLNVAEYNKITKCSICGKEIKRVTTAGGYA